MLGFDALGRLALGQLPGGSALLVAAAGSFPIAGSATFATSQVSAAGSIAFAAVAGAFTVSEPAGSAAFAFTGVVAAFSITEQVSAGSYSFVGVPTLEGISLDADPGSIAYAGAAALFTIDLTMPLGGAPDGKFYGYGADLLGAGESRGVRPGGAGRIPFNAAWVNDTLVWSVEGAAIPLRWGNNTLERTGFDYDVQQGGIGHYLEEMERVRQLARITRKIPPPIDRRTVPRFDPLRASPIAPAAPAVDMQAVQNERMAAAVASSEATNKRRRRDEEALLLLAC